MNPRRRSWLIALCACLLLGAGAAYFAMRTPRYEVHDSGVLRRDNRTGRNEVVIEGQWVPLPEVRRTKLESRLDAALTEQLERQIIAPTVGPADGRAARPPGGPTTNPPATGR